MPDLDVCPECGHEGAGCTCLRGRLQAAIAAETGRVRGRHAREGWDRYLPTRVAGEVEARGNDWFADDSGSANGPVRK
jgi:hypothetical protein